MFRKNIVPIAAGLILSSSSVMAQEAGGVKFSAILLTIAILIGITSSLYVFLLSRKMKGSDVGGALFLYGLGMMSVVISLLSVTWLKSTMGATAAWFHDGFFIFGFSIMVLGSRKFSEMFTR